MNKKGISLVALTITIIVMTIITATIVITGLDLNKTTDLIKFEKSITLIEKTIRKEYIKDNIIGISLKNYELNSNNEQDEFNFTEEELNNILTEIKEIYTTIEIDNEKEEYYLLNKEHLLKLGLNEIYEEYLVNYKYGYVFCLTPVIDENNNNMYTTQFIKELIDTKNEYPLVINSRRNQAINYRIYGNSVQNGTPTPENPVEVQSVGEKVETLFDKSLYSSIDVFNTEHSSGLYLYTYIEGLKMNTDYIVKVIRNNGSKFNSVASTLLISGSTFDVSSGKYTVVSNTSGTDTEEKTYTTDKNGRLTIGISNSNMTQENLNTIFTNTDIIIVEKEDKEYLNKYKIPINIKGKNLVDISKLTHTKSNLIVNETSTNSWTVQGAEGASELAYSAGEIRSVFQNKLEANKDYTLSFYITLLEQGIYNNNFCIYLGNSKTDYAKKQFRYSNLEVGKRVKIETKFNVNFEIGTLTMRLNNNKYLIEMDTMQIEEGTVATEYVQGFNEKINIYLDEPLRGINCYYDYVDFKEQKVYRIINEKVFDGTENFSIFTANNVNYFRIFLSNFEYLPWSDDSTNLYKNGLCNKYPVVMQDNRVNNTLSAAAGNLYTYDFGNNSYETVEAFKENLASEYNKGIPLKIYMVRPTASEQNIQIPEMLLNIGTNTIETATTINPSKIEVQYYEQ
ncbi:MAG: hypothetical protein E7311_05855 [Clostridiales bacterium]|nr:hypothetical protein [Clostridiales bacterium]